MEDEDQRNDWATSNEARRIDKQIEDLRQKKAELESGAKSGKRMSRARFNNLSDRQKHDFIKNQHGEIYDD